MFARIVRLPITLRPGAVTAAISSVVWVGSAGHSSNPGQLDSAGTAKPVAKSLGDVEFTEEFFIDRCDFVPHGRNLFFSLEPGYQLALAGEDEGELIELFITVLDETVEVCNDLDGETECVVTRVVEEREFIDGEIFEVSRNYYARCRQTGDIFYFGEDVCFVVDGECASTEGSWLAGEDGATPGIIMPGTFLLGSRYFQEQAPGIALDRAEHVEMGLTMDVPAGVIEDCVFVFEDSALDPNAESEKTYGPNIGLVADGVLELVSYGFLDEDDDDGEEDDDDGEEDDD